MHKRLVLFTVVILLSISVNVSYFSMGRLSGPVFFDHYLNLSTEHHGVPIVYVDNSLNTRQLNTITFRSEFGEHIMLVQDVQRAKFGKYNMIKGLGRLSNLPFDLEQNQSIELTDPIMKFSDGTLIQQELGQVYVTNTNQGIRPTRFSSSSQGSDQATFNTSNIKAITSAEVIFEFLVNQVYTFDIFDQENRLINQIEMPQVAKLWFSVKSTQNNTDTPIVLVDRIRLKALSSDNKPVTLFYELSTEPSFDKSVIKDLLKLKQN